MTTEDLRAYLAGLDGVVERSTGARSQWRYHGRLVARELEDSQLVIRSSFDRRDAIVRAFPATFSIPTRFASHMMVVADLAHGDRAAIEETVDAAWQLQVEADRVPRGR